MPIEVRELVIRTRIDTAPAPPRAADVPARSRETLVEECVARVLEQLKRRSER
jgi:hypothetical protein